MGYVCGVVPSPRDVRDYHIASAPVAMSYPAEFDITHLHPMPDAESQGSKPTCVACALSTIIEWFSRYQGDEISEFSIGYIYGNRTNSTHKGDGMILRDAIMAVIKCGDVIKELFPYVKNVPEAIEMFEEKREELERDALPHRFSSCYRVYGESEIKAAIKAVNPVAISIRWFNDMRVVNGVMKTSADPSVENGYHAMVIYGWDERGWKVQNSHGAGWGDNGRAILPYDYSIKEAYAITDEITENAKIQRIKELEEENQRLTESNEALQLQINRYVRDITYLNEDITRLNNKITDLKADDEADNAEIQKLIEEVHKKTEEINALTKTVGETVIQLSTSQETLEKKNLEIIDLENQIIELKKPFQSKFGRIVAKVLNFVFLVYDTIMSKRK